MYKLKYDSSDDINWLLVKPLVGYTYIPGDSMFARGYSLQTIPANSPIPEGWYHLYTFTQFGGDSISGQQLGPTDNPPGLGYKALAEAGAYIPMTPLTRRKWYVDGEIQFLKMRSPYTDPDGIVYEDVVSYGWNQTQFFFTLPHSGREAAYNDFISDLHDRAVRNLYASLNKRRKVNGGMILAELKESVGFLGKSATTLLQLVMAIKKGRLSEVKKLLKEYGGGRIPDRILSREQLVRKARREGKTPPTKAEYSSNLWLELQFAILPLMDDIYDMIQYLEETQKKNGATPWLSFSGYSSGSFRSNDVGDGFMPPFNHRVVVTRYNWNISDDVRVAYTATFTLKDPLKDALTAIGLTNPAAIAWGAMPLSFVVDWFIPVNQWIESFTAYAGLELKEVCISTKLTRDMKSDPIEMWEYHRPYYESLYAGPGKPQSIFGQQFTRTIMPPGDENFPKFPQLVTSLDEILQPWKLITASALFRQLSR